MPYEPFSNIIPLDPIPIVDEYIYCNQFTAPTSGSYSHVTIQTSRTSANNYNEKLAAGIYSNIPSKEMIILMKIIT